MPLRSQRVLSNLRVRAHTRIYRHQLISTYTRTIFYASAEAFVDMTNNDRLNLFFGGVDCTEEDRGFVGSILL